MARQRIEHHATAAADPATVYAHTSNLPTRNYRGDVGLEPVAEGTAIRWVSQFDPKLPGTGWILRRALDGFIAKLTDGLAERASAIAAARGLAA
jgi:Polyketide cyclase / dehydrase and lipid transport